VSCLVRVGVRGRRGRARLCPAVSLTHRGGSANTDDVNRDDQYYLFARRAGGARRVFIAGAVAWAAVVVLAGCGGAGKQFSLDATAACFRGQGDFVRVTSGTGDLSSGPQNLPVGSGGDVSVRFGPGQEIAFVAFVRDRDESSTLVGELRALGATDADYGTSGNVVYWSNGSPLSTSRQTLTGCLR
jgi:hypothetical protein